MVQSELVKKRRKQASLANRLTPCECCKHPISQRHHLVRFAKRGENEYTTQLCANCHEVYHIMAQVYRNWYNGNETSANHILGHLQQVWGMKHSTLIFLHELVTKAQSIEGNLGIAEL